MARRESADSIAVEGIKDKHNDGQIDESEYHRRIGGKQWSPRPGISNCHLNDQRFSSRSVTNRREMVISRMQTDIAAPSGQSYAAPNRLCTMLAIMVAEAPPTSNGARKSPSERTNASVAPASKPGIESGRITRRNVARRLAPRSCDASTRGRGMCSRDA